MRIPLWEMSKARRSLFTAAFLVAALAAVFMGAPGPAIAADPSPILLQKAPEAATISDTADLQGYVPIIVEFASPIPPSAMRPDPAVLGPLKAQIAATQNAIIATHFGSVANPRPGQGFDRALRLHDITPMMSLNVSKAELDQIAVLREQFLRNGQTSVIRSPTISASSIQRIFGL